MIEVLKAAGHDLVIVETPGIGQGDEFGAASQLEKIDMLDFADVVAINKFERRGAKDALRDVGRQLVRNRQAFGKGPAEMPVFGTSAAHFNDDGVTALYQELRDVLGFTAGALPNVTVRHSSEENHIIPPARVRYLSEITETVRSFHAQTEHLADAADRAQRLALVAGELGDDDRVNDLAALATARAGRSHETSSAGRRCS